MNAKQVNNLKSAALLSAAFEFYRLLDSLAFEEWFITLMAFIFWCGVGYWLLQRSQKNADALANQEALKREASSMAESLDSSSGADAVHSKK